MKAYENLTLTELYVEQAIHETTAIRCLELGIANMAANAERRAKTIQDEIDKRYKHGLAPKESP